MRRLLIIVLSVAISSILFSCATATQENMQLEQATVIRVIDGDTLVVQRDSIQGPEKVRLIGIDTPESVASEEYLAETNKQNTQAGRDASIFTATIAPAGATVWLQLDEEPQDQYGRTLAYVWVELPSSINSEEEIRQKMLNAILLTEGYASPMSIAPNTRYKQLFMRLANQ